MQRDLENALEEILVIKHSIGGAKENKEKLYKILMILGLINLAYYGTRIIAAIIFNVHVFGRFHSISVVLNILIYAVFFIYYIKMYKEEKNSSNKYYLSFLNVFAGMTFLLPVLIFIIKMIYFFTVPDGMATELIIQSLDMRMLSDILLLCFSIIICGYILRKKSILFLSVVILFIYMILSLVYNDIVYSIGISETPASISLVSIYYSLAISMGYIMIAMILKYGGNDANGRK